MSNATATRDRKPRVKRPKVGRTTLNLDKFEVSVNLADLGACSTDDEDSFFVTCSLSTRQLDVGGYVIETRSFVNSIKAAFDPRHMLRASCEQLAAGVAEVAYRIMGDRLDRIVVNIDNTTGGATFVWRRRMEAPAFPRLATNDEREATELRRRNGAQRGRC